jgi:hypothetical protein
MRAFLVVVFSLSLISSEALAQTSFWVESSNHAGNGEFLPQVNAMMTWRRAADDKVGIYFWTLTGKEYAEAIVGVSYSPAPWVEVSFGPGIEQDPELWRVNANLWVGKDGFSYLGIVETGATGFWYKTTVEIPVAPFVKVGGFAQKFKGASPHVAVSIPNTPFSLTLDALLWRDNEWNGFILGVKSRF